MCVSFNGHRSIGQSIMRDVLRPLFRCALVIAAFCLLAVHERSFAQSGTTTVTATWAAGLTRYYAPYALQAAAAYLSVSSFDQTRGPSGEPALNGVDVAYALTPYAGSTDSLLATRATRYLRAWQYQFGSDQYLGCLDDRDTDCQKELPGRWTFSFGGGPAFQVWARTHYPHVAHDACTEVSIAFRGTVGFTDWISNADPISHYLVDDYYLQLRRNINAVIRKIANLDCYKRAARRPQIVSVGHSLGGGLAQFAALANKPSEPRIAKVFAFDSSPVTGSSLIDRQTLLRNANGLEIDRVYQSGEVLREVRKYYEQFPKSSSRCNPLVRTVAFDLSQGSAVGLHSMTGLAGQIVEASYKFPLPFAVPDAVTDCRTRYRPPATDEDQTPAPSVYPGETVYRSDGSIVRVAQANLYLRAYDQKKVRLGKMPKRRGVVVASALYKSGGTRPGGF